MITDINNTFKKDLEHFEYDKRYPTLIEHRWCYLRNNNNLKVFYKRKAKLVEPKISIVQKDPEKTGQIGTMC